MAGTWAFYSVLTMWVDLADQPQMDWLFKDDDGNERIIPAKFSRNLGAVNNDLWEWAVSSTEDMLNNPPNLDTPEEEV